MHISVMICDDLEEERAAMARMVDSYGRRHGLAIQIEGAAGGEELLAQWAPGRWDLVFLDIFMPGLSGVETARRLRAADRTCALVFATTSQEHGLESFELQVMDYLVKPVGQAAVDQAMDWFVGQEAARLRLLRVGTEGEEDAETVRVGEVDYIEICRHTAVVRAAGRVYEVRRTMDALEEELNDSRFFRCHRSYLVNLDRVRQIDHKDFVMESGDRVPISSKCAAEARRRFQEWLLAKNWGM